MFAVAALFRVNLSRDTPRNADFRAPLRIDHLRGEHSWMTPGIISPVLWEPISVKDSAEIKNFMNESEPPIHFSRGGGGPLSTLGILPPRAYISYSPLFTRITAPFRYTPSALAPRGGDVVFSCTSLSSPPRPSLFHPPVPLLLARLPSSLPPPPSPVLRRSLSFGAALSHNRPDDSAVHQNGMACWAHVWVR